MLCTKNIHINGFDVIDEEVILLIDVKYPLTSNINIFILDVNANTRFLIH